MAIMHCPKCDYEIEIFNSALNEALADNQRLRTNLGEARSLLKRYEGRDNDITIFLVRTEKEKKDGQKRKTL
jgi:hypothetical protein